jgi:tetratricopeptide (TPR) repeat protein
MIYAVALALAVVAAAFVPPLVKGHVSATVQYQPHEVEAAKESIALSLLGQLQLSIGDLMWLKSMEYLHVGLVQRMPTRAEEAHGHMRHESQGTAAGLGHVEGVNMTLDEDRDFRGWLGRIEREIKPYSTAHQHDDPVEIIPWYQLAVRLNPRLERLYTLGAFYMADFAHEPGEARELLLAGMTANPQSWEIRAALGRLYVEFADRLNEITHDDHHDEPHDDEDIAGSGSRDSDHHDAPDSTHTQEESEVPASAPEAYQEAAELLREAIDIASAHRRELAANREKFDDFQNQVFSESYLFLSKAHAALGDYDTAIAIADEGYEAVGQTPNRSHLRVQKRIVERRRAGEQADAGDLMLLARSRQTTDGTPHTISDDGKSRLNLEEPTMPISVVLNIVAPDPSELVAVPELGRTLLEDIRRNPYESAEARRIRLGIESTPYWTAITALERHKFVASDAEQNSGSHSKQHVLTPIGLYVSMGHFGLDFWNTMRSQADALKSHGIEIDVSKPDEARQRYAQFFLN